MFVLSKKLELVKQDIIGRCGCQTGCSKCSSQLRFITRLADAGIPVAYWFLKMSDFSGAENIKKATETYIASIKQSYQDGSCICFAGTLGTGKTYSMTNILKAALAKDFTAYYTSLSDIVNNLTNFETKYRYNDLVCHSDFLAIDEVDSRHIASSDAAKDFFGANFERIIRFRVQNKLPTLMATNNAGIEEAFGGQFRKTIESLASSKMLVVPALGKDYRLSGEKV